MTGFTAVQPRFPAGTRTAPPLRVTPPAVLPAPPARAITRAVGGQAREQRAVGAVEQVHVPSKSVADHDRGPTTSGARQPRCSSRSAVQAAVAVVAPPGGDAVAASAPNTSCGVAAECRRAADGLVHSSVPRSASTQPTAAWNARAQTVSPTRLTGPTRSARRSTSLVPRGVASAPPSAPCRRRIEAGQAPALPDHQRVLDGGSRPAWRSASGSPGRCCVHRLAPVAAVEGVHRCGPRPARTRARRPPAARVYDARELLAPQLLAAVEHDQLVVARDHGGEAPSLPTPAASGAPALPRHSSRPVSASSASTVPSLAATTAARCR